MKIAIIAWYHPESSLCLAKHIAAQGTEVDYYYIDDILRSKNCVSGFNYHSAPRRPGIVELKGNDCPEIFRYFGDGKYTINLLRIPSFSPKARILSKLILKFALRKIRQKKYDAINIIGQTPWVIYVHNYLRNENITHSLHEVTDHSATGAAPIPPLLDAIIKDRSKVILHSRTSLQRFLALSDSYPVEKAAYIPFGIFETYPYFQPSTDFFKTDNRRFVFYGFFKPYKGFDLLKEAIRLMQEQTDKYEFIIAGTGYDANTEELSKLKNVTVINRFLTNEDMVALNSQCDAIVCPYHSASQSGIVTTGFAFNKPIVATAVGAFVESIRDGVNGMLVPAKSASGLAKALMLLVEQPEILQKLSAGTQDFQSSGEFSWEKIAGDSIKFYSR